MFSNLTYCLTFLLLSLVFLATISLVGKGIVSGISSSKLFFGIVILVPEKNSLGSTTEYLLSFLSK